MSDSDPQDEPSTQSSQPSPPPHTGENLPDPSDEHEIPGGHDRHIQASQKIIGVALMFVGFLNVLLSLTGDYNMSVIPLILYCAGLAVWAHASIPHPGVRWSFIGGAVILALIFFHRGEVLWWDKFLIFLGTIYIVVYFMLDWWAALTVGLLIVWYYGLLPHIWLALIVILTTIAVEVVRHLLRVRQQEGHSSS